MNHLNPNKVGLTLGAMVGGLHVVWSLLVLLGWAQPLFDFIFQLHMINPFVEVLPFDIGSAVSLILLTFVIGFIVGKIFALVWNRFHR